MGFFNWAAPLFGHFADRWSPEGIAEIADWLRPFMSDSCPEGCRILDVGGGTGALARKLHVALCAQVTVVDPTPEMLNYISDGDGVSKVQGSAEALPFDDDAFDAVNVTHAFHHLPDQPAAVREFRRVTRHGGGVVIVELDPAGMLMRAIVLGEKLLGEPGAFMTPSQMCAFMREHGVEGSCSEIRGVSYRFVGKVRG